MFFFFLPLDRYVAFFKDATRQAAAPKLPPHMDNESDRKKLAASPPKPAAAPEPTPAPVKAASGALPPPWERDRDNWLTWVNQ